jgi:rubrerythrin
MKTYTQFLAESKLSLINDLQIIRSSIKEEFDATSIYESNAEAVSDPRAKALYKELARDEKQHAQELQKLLEDMDPEYKKEDIK